MPFRIYVITDLGRNVTANVHNPNEPIYKALYYLEGAGRATPDQIMTNSGCSYGDLTLLQRKGLIMDAMDSSPARVQELMVGDIWEDLAQRKKTWECKTYNEAIDKQKELNGKYGRYGLHFVIVSEDGKYRVRAITDVPQNMYAR